MRNTALVLLLTTVSVPVASRAAPTASCHCFRDRTFDPAEPALTDPYIRATTRNSLLSAAYGIPKREIVQAEMTGTAPEDLWIAHWAGAQLGQSASALLDLRSAKGSWKAALSPSRARLGKEFGEALDRAAPDADLAGIAVRDVLARRLHADAAATAALAKAGAGPADLIVATVLATRLKRPATEVWRPVGEGRKSWGTVLNEAGIAPPDMDGVVRALVR